MHFAWLGLKALKISIRPLIRNCSHTMQRLLTLLFALIPTVTQAITPSERQDLLNAIRPEASRLAGQAVRIKVDTLNYQNNWAVLVGQLVPPQGKTLDWRKAQDCDPNLDKMLWVVAQKQASGWQVQEIFICSPEPVYWYLVPEEAFVRPCGIYAGLQTGQGATAQQECLAFQAKRRR